MEPETFDVVTKAIENIIDVCAKNELGADEEKCCGVCANWSGPFTAELVTVSHKREPSGRNSYALVKTTRSKEYTFGRCSILTDRKQCDETPPFAGFGCSHWQRALGNVGVAKGEDDG
jgi:hypothetical protein